MPDSRKTPAERVAVRIAGREYLVRGGSAPEVRKAAQRVDRLMRRIQNTQEHLSSYDVAVLAALNLAASAPPGEPDA